MLDGSTANSFLGLDSEEVDGLGVFAFAGVVTAP